MEGSLLSCHQVLPPWEGLILTLWLPCHREARVGKASVRPLHLGRETALGREGQAEASVCSDLNPCSQCCLRGVTLCTRPESVSMFPSGGGHIQQGPGRAHARGGCENPSPSRGLISLPFTSAQATWMLSERESCCQGFTDLFSF